MADIAITAGIMVIDGIMGITEVIVTIMETGTVIIADTMVIVTMAIATMAIATMVIADTMATATMVTATMVIADIIGNRDYNGYW
jgi:hypothetical protein